jgi:hypothetical protein
MSVNNVSISSGFGQTATIHGLPKLTDYLKGDNKSDNRQAACATEKRARKDGSRYPS